LKTHYVFRTRNSKTGRVDLSVYRSHGTCSPTCPLWNNGCYAENYPNLFMIADRYGFEGDDYTPLIEAIDKVRSMSGKNAVVRFNVSGDYLDDHNQPDKAYIEATNHARGLNVLSYTHAWRVLDPQWFYTTTRPNASCDTLRDVVIARDAGWSTTIVDPYDGIDPWGEAMAAREGFLNCLHTEVGLQCVDCKLCARTSRKSTVVFPVHGTKKRAAKEVLLAQAQ